MKKLNKFVVAGAMALAIGATSVTAFAASSYRTPAETLADVTGKTVEKVNQEKNQTGECYGRIAKDSGKLQEFKDARLEDRKSYLQDKVKSGEITQEKADEIINNMKERQANCNGEGIGKGFRMGGFSGLGNNN